MKRLGVQLAGSGIVVLLGALGVAQAQRDSHNEEAAQWEQQATPAMTPPPAPIAAVEDEPDAAEAAPSTFGFGGFHTTPAVDPNIRTVSHDEPIAATTTSEMSFPAAGANGSPASDPAAAAPGSFGTPGGMSAFAMPAAAPANASKGSDMNSQPAAPSASAFSFGTPSMHDMAETEEPSDAAPIDNGYADDAPSADYAALPTMQFGGAPSNGLRGAASEETAPDQFGSDPSAATPLPTLPAATAAAEQPGFYSESAPMQNFAMPLKTTAEQTPTAAPGAMPGYRGYGQSQPATLQPLESSNAQPLARNPSLTNGMTTSLASRGANAAAPALSPEAELVLAEPGDRRLEGMQTPSIVIQKRAPEEVKVGKPATFVIHVQNTGSVEALGVQVIDRVPAGMRLLDASPAPRIEGDLLTWQLGALEPSGERTVTLQLVPEREGELGSVARVTFEAAASVRTISTRPDLKIVQRAPEQVLIGQQLEIELEVSNPGTGVATGVILQEDVPDGLEHPKGKQLDNVIGSLAPGEVRRQVLRLRAVAPGQIQNIVRLVGDDGLTTESTVNVQVIAPQLALELEGPNRRFLERQATFNVNLANVGTADATNVELVAYLDRGFSFVSTEYEGQYDPAKHAVYWSLAELPAEGHGSVPLRLLPIQEGERAIRLEAVGDLNLAAQHEKVVSVDTLAELTFSITDDSDPIEVGSDVTYEIRINNRGSRDDADVRLQMMLPAGLQLVRSDSEASTNDRGLIAFAPTLTLPAGQEIVHRVVVRGLQPGTHIVKAMVTSQQSTTQVMKEESTMVYADQ